ncbi:MAG: hypothetical protein GYA16_15575 [Spirochaetes bacterium]|nr:hypothetical protein [Spirochaetota bacterium]
MKQIHDNSLSVYGGNVVTKQVLIMELLRLKKAFPAITNDFVDILAEMVIRERFTEQRLHDAIDHLIKTYEYQHPTVASVLKYDKRVQFHSYADMCDMVDKYGSGVWEIYQKVRLQGQSKPVWVKKSDIETYNLKHLLYEEK